MTSAAAETRLAADFRRTYRRDGFIRDAGSVSAADLAMLRSVCDDLQNEPLDDGGSGGRHRIGLGENRRFLAHRHEDFPQLKRFVINGPPARLAVTALGAPCYLFNEQFVVKGAGAGAGFAWHQDGAYVGSAHEPYVSVWIALDDVSEVNGCLRVMQRNLDEANYLDAHEWVEETRELNGYSGGESGFSVLCGAGGMVLFSSLTLHCSGPNRSRSPRRAYLAQYSPEIILDSATGEPKRFSAPVCVDR